MLNQKILTSELDNVLKRKNKVSIRLEDKTIQQLNDYWRTTHKTLDDIFDFIFIKKGLK